MNDESLYAAIARAWCTPENSHKEMDPDLVFAIEQEVAVWSRHVTSETMKWRYEFQRADSMRQHAMEILVGIHNLLNPKLVEANGKTYEFRDPNVPASERWQLLSDRIRQISDLVLSRSTSKEQTP